MSKKIKISIAVVATIAVVYLAIGLLRDHYAKTIAQEKVTELLRDPSSAEFKDMHVVKSDKDARSVMVCLKVNAKNAMGGYTGYQQFLVSFRKNNVWIETKKARVEALDEESLFGLVCKIGD